MISAEISKFRNVLNEHLGELSAGMQRRDAIAIEQTAEELERRSMASERELAMQMIEGESSARLCRQQPEVLR